MPMATSTITPTSHISCPNANLTLYIPSSRPEKRYLLLCDRDYNSGHGTIDLYNTPTATFAECVDLCAQHTGCLGAGWGAMSGKGTTVCWIKGYLGAWHSAPDW